MVGLSYLEVAVNAIQIEVAKAAIAQMLQNGHFNICTIDQVLKITGGVPPRETDEAIAGTALC